MAIAVPDELQESVGQGSEGCEGRSWQARGMAIQLRKEWSLSTDRTSSPEMPAGNETERPPGNNTEMPSGNDTGMLRKPLKVPWPE